MVRSLLLVSRIRDKFNIGMGKNLGYFKSNRTLLKQGPRQRGASGPWPEHIFSKQKENLLIQLILLKSLEKVLFLEELTFKNFLLSGPTMVAPP